MPYFMSRLPCHPRLQSYTWRTGEVLTWLFLTELNETFSIGFTYIIKQLGINFIGHRNHPVLQDSKRSHGGQGESWWTHSCQKWMKLTVKVHYAFLHTLVGTSLGSGTNLSSKTPGWCLEDRVNLDGHNHVLCEWNTFYEILMHLCMTISNPCNF